MADQVTAGRFVGRTNELAWLHQLLARAADGHPLVALVGGEAGVGKTRLVEQLAATARGRGVRVLGGGCVPLGEEGLPFAPVIEALRGLADDLDADELQAVAGPARQELARLLPDLPWGGEAAAGPRSPAEPVRGGCSSGCYHWAAAGDHVGCANAFMQLVDGIRGGVRRVGRVDAPCLAGHCGR